LFLRSRPTAKLVKRTRNRSKKESTSFPTTPYLNNQKELNKIPFIIPIRVGLSRKFFRALLPYTSPLYFSISFHEKRRGL
jgi:hypothetical protein